LAGVADAEDRLHIWAASRRPPGAFSEDESKSLLLACGFHESFADDIAFFWRPHRVQQIVRYTLGQINTGTHVRGLCPWMAAWLMQREHRTGEEVFPLRVNGEMDRFSNLIGRLKATFGRKRNGKAAMRG